jgi:hypothetical protein
MGRKSNKSVSDYTEENKGTDRAWYEILEGHDLPYSTRAKQALVKCLTCEHHHRMTPGRLQLDGTTCTCCSKRYNANIRDLFKELGYIVDDGSLIVEKCFAVTAKDNEILINAGIKPKKNIRMDFCIPSKNVIFELNGGGNHNLIKHQILDEWKRNICAAQGYRTVYIKTKGQILEEKYEQKVKDALEATK